MLWDTAAGQPIRELMKESLCFYMALAFSVDGSNVLVEKTGPPFMKMTLDLLNVATGRIIHAFNGDKISNMDAGTDSHTLSFSPDGETIIADSGDYREGGLELWDAASGRQICAFSTSDDDGFAAAFLPDGKTVLCGNGNTVRLWDAATGSLRYSAAANDQGEWFSWTPEGFFSGSDWATHNLVHIVDKMKIFGIDQVYNVYYRPDLVAAKASGQDISSHAEGLDLESLLHGSAGGLPPLVRILGPQPGNCDKRDVQVQLRVTDQGGGVGRITVFNGDTPVVLSDEGAGRGIKIVTNSFAEGQDYQALLSLRSGKNTISVSAYNKSDTIESSRSSVELVYESTDAKNPTCTSWRSR